MPLYEASVNTGNKELSFIWASLVQKCQLTFDANVFRHAVSKARADRKKAIEKKDFNQMEAGSKMGSNYITEGEREKNCLMQNRNRTNFIFIKRGSSVFKIVARVFTLVYVRIFSVLYNIFSLLTNQNGFKELSTGDIVFFTFAIGGSILCLFFRFIIFIRIAQDIKSKVCKFITMACQILCVAVFFVSLLFVLYYTNGGTVDWHYLRVYVEFELALLCIVFLQETTYMTCASWMKLITNRDRFIRFCFILCFILGLIFTLVFGFGVLEYVKDIKIVGPY